MIEWRVRLGGDLNAIKAVAQVETRSDPFYPWSVPAHTPFRAGSVPAMLFERHIFHQQAGGEFDQRAADLSNSNPGGYGRNRVQPERLNRAKALDNHGAIEATSYGQYQIVGRDQQGCPSAEIFERAMGSTELEHLHAFEMYLLASPAMLRPLRAHNWRAFALRYNGPTCCQGTTEHHYDQAMSAAYNALPPIPASAPAPAAGQHP